MAITNTGTISALSLEYAERLEKTILEKLEDVKDEELTPEVKKRLARTGRAIQGYITRTTVFNEKLSEGDLADFNASLATMKKFESAALVIGKEIAQSVAAEFAKEAGALASVFARMFAASLGIKLPS